MKSPSTAVSACLCALAIAILAVVVLYQLEWHDAPEEIDPNSIMVVAAATASVSGKVDDTRLDSPERRENKSPSEALAYQVFVRFPLLKGVTVTCGNKDCQMSASLPASTSGQEREKREAMLLGELDRFLAAQGYSQTAAMQLDEIGDDEYRIRVMLRPI